RDGSAGGLSALLAGLGHGLGPAQAAPGPGTGSPASSSPLTGRASPTEASLARARGRSFTATHGGGEDQAPVAPSPLGDVTRGGASGSTSVRAWVVFLLHDDKLCLPSARGGHAFRLTPRAHPSPVLGSVGEGIEGPIQVVYLSILLSFLVVGAYLVVRQVLARRELEEAAKVFGDRVRSGEGSGEDYLELGVILLRKKLYTQSIKNLEKAKKAWKGPQEELAKVYNAQGFAHFNLEQWSKAAAAYKQAVELQPQYVTAWNNLGDAYEKAKEWRQALDAYNQALVAEPGNSVAQGRAQYCRGKVERMQLGHQTSLSPSPSLSYFMEEAELDISASMCLPPVPAAYAPGSTAGMREGGRPGGGSPAGSSAYRSNLSARRFRDLSAKATAPASRAAPASEPMTMPAISPADRPPLDVSCTGGAGGGNRDGSPAVVTTLLPGEAPGGADMAPLESSIRSYMLAASLNGTSAQTRVELTLMQSGTDPKLVSLAQRSCTGPALLPLYSGRVSVSRPPPRVDLGVRRAGAWVEAAADDGGAGGRVPHQHAADRGVGVRLAHPARGQVQGEAHVFPVRARHAAAWREGGVLSLMQPPPVESGPGQQGYPPEGLGFPPSSDPGHMQQLVDLLGSKVPPKSTAVVECPKTMVGRVIGKGGETIKALQQYTGAMIQIDQSSDPTRVTIAGLPQALQLAVSMVNDIVRGTFKGFAMLRQIALANASSPGMATYGQQHAPVYVQGYGFVPPSQAYGGGEDPLAGMFRTSPAGPITPPISPMRGAGEGSFSPNLAAMLLGGGQVGGQPGYPGMGPGAMSQGNMSPQHQHHHQDNASTDAMLSQLLTQLSFNQQAAEAAASMQQHSPHAYLSQHGTPPGTPGSGGGG
ncbi:hypothetical protein APUTEX25_004580, partial [Auxenochlorella protothecoides]